MESATWVVSPFRLLIILAFLIRIILACPDSRELMVKNDGFLGGQKTMDRKIQAIP
jgi:hypothetical protein